jgi:hypothetical protein
MFLNTCLEAWPIITVSELAVSIESSNTIVAAGACETAKTLFHSGLKRFMMRLMMRIIKRFRLKISRKFIFGPAYLQNCS